MTLPSDFIDRTKAILGDEFYSLEKALREESPVSVRMNKDKQSDIPAYERIPWSESGYYLPKRIPFTFDPLFHAGGYYVQEASSMFLEQAIRHLVSDPVVCLDLCAAPGGKSTHLSSLLPKGSLLVSNEVIRSRSQILAENMIKWGDPNVIVTNNDPKEIGNLPHLFDLIVADLPCSGEGMFRKDPESMNEWSVANVELCASRQRRIIHDCWDALKPGGLLIYSTCTYNLEENEENIQYLTHELGAEALSLPIKEAWNISGALKYTNPVYRFFPHRTRGEGFFLAVLRKEEEEVRQTKSPSQKKQKGKGQSQPIPEETKQWVESNESFCFEMRGNNIIAIPAIHYNTYQHISNKLHLLSAGITIGEPKGKDIIPAQSLALSCVRKADTFPSIDLDWRQAILYLRKEVLLLPPDSPKGHLLATYRGLPLGFLKNIGNRANNLYPQEWRIRSGYIPESPIDLLQHLL